MDQNQSTSTLNIESPRTHQSTDAPVVATPQCLFYLKAKKATFKKLVEMNASVALINGRPSFDKKKRVLCIKH